MKNVSYTNNYIFHGYSHIDFTVYDLYLRDFRINIITIKAISKNVFIFANTGIVFYGKHDILD